MEHEEISDATIVDRTQPMVSQDKIILATIKEDARKICSVLQVLQGAIILMRASPDSGLTLDMIKDSLSLAILELNQKIVA